jgi:anti-anti-sigma factor
MELRYREMKNGIRLIELIGKLDTNGVIGVESNFVLHCAGSRVKVIVDLSKMKFLAPSGSDLLLWTAKEVKHRGGSLVLVNPLSAIEYELEQTGIQEWSPIHPDLEAAIAFLLAPQPAKNAG